MLLSSYILILFTCICLSSGFDDGKIFRCQDENGRLLPVATICEDERKDCKKIFKGFAHDFFRPLLCDKNDMSQKALKCAKTCGICCEKPDYEYDNSASVE